MKFIDMLYLELASFIRSTPYDIIIQNFIDYPYECDMLRFKDSGAVYEYEIKTSKSDYFADFKKGFYEKNKHESLKNGELAPNYFLFVLPGGMIPKEEIPNHCGLIEYSYYPPGGYSDKGYISLRLVKNAKRLHKRKFEKWIDLARRMSFRDCQRRKVDIYRVKTNEKIKFTNIPAFVEKSVKNR